ncbi:hypothetical protein FGB62_12g441 [Gracilaria domingensis]|nr:hypothetical protein FGB62_12g441 [Gracilaria domingensis]
MAINLAKDIRTVHTGNFRPDMGFARCWEELAYQHRMADIISRLYAHYAPLVESMKIPALYPDENLQSPKGGLFQFPAAVNCYARALGVRNILRGSNYALADVRNLLDDVCRTDWFQKSGFFWSDYEADAYHDMPRHPAGKNIGKKYANMPPYRLVRERVPNSEHAKSKDSGLLEVRFVSTCLENSKAPPPGPSIPVNSGPTLGPVGVEKYEEDVLIQSLGPATLVPDVAIPVRDPGVADVPATSPDIANADPVPAVISVGSAAAPSAAAHGGPAGGRAAAAPPAPVVAYSIGSIAAIEQAPGGALSPEVGAALAAPEECQNKFPLSQAKGVHSMVPPRP